MVTEAIDPFEGMGVDGMVGVTEAAAKLSMDHRVIRNAIKRGELEALIPTDRDPRRTGRLGYRIPIPALRRWYFGK